GGGKLGREGKGVGRVVGHGHKMPRCKWRANHKLLTGFLCKPTSSARGGDTGSSASRLARIRLKPRTAEGGRRSPAIMGGAAASRAPLHPPAPPHRAHAGRRSAGPARFPRAAPARRRERTAAGAAA